MCKDCGCGLPDKIGPAPPTEDRRRTVEVMHGLMEANDRAAAHNREHFDRTGTLVVNLMSSPGAGKTRLLEETARRLGQDLRIAVIEGDLETENDAERLRACGVRAHQITTGSACHLDAHMIHRALHDFPLEHVDILFIENVGNLVCPAAFDLGQHANVVLLSVTEGDDKPAKYPVMFRAADLVVLSKADLLEVLDDFSPARAAAALGNLGIDTSMIQTAAGRRVEVRQWLNWLEQRLALHRRSADRAAAAEA